MIELHLTDQELVGALAIAIWLNETIKIEGLDRPAFSSIAHYIVSDILDAVDAGATNNV